MYNNGALRGDGGDPVPGTDSMPHASAYLVHTATQQAGTLVILLSQMKNLRVEKVVTCLRLPN